MSQAVKENNRNEEQQILTQSDRDKELSRLVKGSYHSLRVVGRGTVRIDAGEVTKTEKFQHALTRAKKIVNKKT